MSLMISFPAVAVDFVPCRSLPLWLFLDEYHQGLVRALQKSNYLVQSGLG